MGQSGLVKDIPDAARRLGSGGLVFRVGHYTLRVQTPFKTIQNDFLSVYGDYPAGSLDDFVDYHLKVEPTTWYRRWIRPNVTANAGMTNTPFVPLPLDIGILSLEMGLNWLLGTTAGRFVVFHSGVVERDGKVILMPGISGTGKSTLTAGLAFNGYRLFSDEFGIFDPENWRFYPYPRPISLKNRSIDVMAERLPESQFSRPFFNTPKGTIRYLRPTPEAIARMAEPATPHLVLFPEYRPQEEPQVVELRDAEAFIMIRGAAVNTDRLGIRAFNGAVDLTRKCRSFRLVYRSLDQGLRMVNDLMEQF